MTNNIGEILSELMIFKNLSAIGLGEIIGVKNVTVNRWLKGERILHLNNAVKVCDYFNCSLEFLAGRTETIIDFTPCNPPPFYAALKKVMDEKQLTRYRVIKETKKSARHFDRWKAGSDPSLQSLVELSDYFDVTIDYLVGREH